MTLKALARQTEKLVIDNSPSILTALGVVGTVTTAVLAGRASIRAHDILQNEPANTTTKDKVVIVWQEYIPAVGVGTITIAAIIMANRIGSRRAAAMAAAYTLSEKAFMEYRDKVVEKIGPNKEQLVRAEVAQDAVRQNPSSQVNILGNNEVLCYDSLTGRYFSSSMETLKRAQNEINHKILSDGYASLSDFYEMVGLSATSLSEELGWTMDKLLELRFSSVLSENDQPCLSIEFSSDPIRNYHKFG